MLLPQPHARLTAVSSASRPSSISWRIASGRVGRGLAAPRSNFPDVPAAWVATEQ